MDFQQIRDGRRVAPPKSALGRNIVFLYVAIRGCHPPPSAVCAVRMMNETKYQAGFRWQIQAFQWFEIFIVCSPARHRHVHKVDLTGRGRTDGVRKSDRCGKALWLDNMLMTRVPVTKMDTALNAVFDQTA